MKKQMEGDNRQRRQRAREARAEDKAPSEVGTTTGASKQREHLRHGEPHPERIEEVHRGKADPEHQPPRPRPGSV